MYLIKNMKSILLFIACFLSTLFSYGQLEFGNAYVMGDHVNVAISGERGREGTSVIGAGFHQRAPGTRCGFVADPYLTSWDPTGHTGDYFMPGTEENGWGVEDAGTNYSNNYNVYEVIFDPGATITHEVEGDCITAEWQGTTPTGLIINLKYHLVQDELFYTTEVTMINTTGTDKNDVYWYRNVDPDNDQSLSGSYTTTNTIASQPVGECQKALVSAEQFTPHDSYLGFGALGDKFRVSHGGFSNRSGSDIWNGTGGLEGGVDVVEVADQAISLAYRDTVPAGDTVNFTFAVVLSEDAVENAFSSLYYIDYESIGGIGGGLINQCNPLVDTAQSCAGGPVTLTVDGPNAGDYTWEWTSEPLDPDAPTDGVTIVVSPDLTTTYTVVGTPISDCLVSTISKTIVVEFTEGPDIDITDPGPYCEDFVLADLVFTDLNGTEDPNIVFLTEEPDSADQTEPEAGPTMGPDDDVWLLIGDPDGGCYDFVKLEIDFGGLGAAGEDSSIALCGTSGTIIDLHDLIEEGANPLGDFEEVTASGQFNEATGELNVGGLGGTYVFTYTVEGVAPCPDDDATFTVVVYPQPEADFEYEVDGVSSADGLGSTCIINTVEFFDFSTIPPGGTITSWDWDFGGDGTSTLEDPTHLFTTTGTFVISLTVTTDDGCTSTFTKEIIIYTEPILDAIFNEPTCFGFTDGSITAFVAGGSGTFDIEIVNEDGDIVNAPGSNTANTLGAGTYTVTVMDGSGCTATTTVTLVNPPALDAFYTVVPPLCFGDTGYITVDSVVGEAINNAVAYFWAPVTDVPNGFDADSVNVPAGDYVLTINDSKGCSNVITITMTEPPELVGTVGYEPAYCRLYDYQSGNGVVFASASGGTGDPSTPYWVYLDAKEGEDDDATQGTWGGRNPGRYVVTIEDDNGCVFTDTVVVDSLNPIADFTVTSDQLNADCKGTAQVDAIFTNTSLYFANPNNPTADSTFFWNLDTLNTSFYIVDNYEYAPDSSYVKKGQTYEVEVCLIAQNKNGCQDTKCKTLTIFEPIVIPDVNIFSPNNDGVNDEFTFTYKAASISELEIVIVNRWGVKVGEITEPNGTWDGTDMNGTPCRDGVYFYTFEITTDNGETFSGHHSLQIINSEGN